MNETRRAVVEKVVKSALLSLTFNVGGAAVLLTPKQARARAVPTQNLDAQQVKLLERLGDTILPGASELGLAHFVDHQLGVDPNDCMLIAKYFQVPPPYKDFYAGGVAATVKFAKSLTGKSIQELNDSELARVVQSMTNPAAAVDGFSIFLFYLCLRSDAVDVVYGTPDGFKKLNIPYMEHILPPEGWDG